MSDKTTVWVVQRDDGMNGQELIAVCESSEKAETIVSAQLRISDIVHRSGYYVELWTLNEDRGW